MTAPPPGRRASLEGVNDPRHLPSWWPRGREFGAGTAPVRDPYTGAVIAEIPVATATDVDAAIERALRCLPPPPPVDRAEILERAAALIRDRRDDFARVIALEAGKPLVQARGEADRCVDTLTYSAIEARRLASDGVPLEGTHAGVGRLGFVVREPVGVIGAIAPFNFPLNLVAHKVGPAIAAGCPILLKPAPATPLSALGLAQVLAEAGLPDDAFHVLPGDVAVGDAIVHHPDTALISFTGSQAVGRAIQTSVPTKPVLLELGNAAPVIVDADADLDLAADRIAASGYTHAGQSCVSVQRVYAVAAVYEDLVERLATRVSALRLGDPLDPDTDVGPVISDVARDRVQDVIDDAVAHGGRVVVGGRQVEGNLTPTLIADLHPDAALSQHEVFGPVIGIASVASMEEGCDRANATDLGLQAGIFTARVDRAIVLARRLQFGGVLINETPTYRADQMPYGGVKESGNTREGPASAVALMTVEKLIVIRLPDSV